jgi:hypothetical protein
VEFNINVNYNFCENGNILDGFPQKLIDETAKIMDSCALF